MRRHSRGQGAVAALLFGLTVTALGGFTACDRTSGADADNTARNARDSNGKTVTPTDQSESRRIVRCLTLEIVDETCPITTPGHCQAVDIALYRRKFC